MRLVRTMVVLAFIALLVGCSTFNRDYVAALKATPASESVEGAWQGIWRSDAGHGSDELRCIVTPGVGSLHARFKAKYWAIFEIEEEVDLVSPSSAWTVPVHASGKADLGYFKGGIYLYEATLTPSEFCSTYKSQYDHGVFILQRPAH